MRRLSCGNCWTMRRNGRSATWTAWTTVASRCPFCLTSVTPLPHAACTLCLTPVTHFHWCRLLSKSQPAFSSLDPWLLTFPALLHYRLLLAVCRSLVVCRPLHCHRYLFHSFFLPLIESLGKC